MDDRSAELPYVDEHFVNVDADRHAVWDAVLYVVERAFSSPRATTAARALGCRDRAAAGPRPLAAGSAFPGFHVAAADAPHELPLIGRHRYSAYALTFRLAPAEEAGAGRVRLSAETRAAFPGLQGRTYRALVVGTGLHVRVTRRLLTAAKLRAERG